MEDIFDLIKEEQDNVMSIRLKDNGGGVREVPSMANCMDCSSKLI